MDVDHATSGRWGTKTLESRHQAENAGTANSSPSRFFSRLRPSQRPERGGTARPTPATDGDGEHRPAQPVPPGSSSASRRRKTSPSPARHPPGTIAANHWSSPAPAPSQIHTVGRTRSRELFLAMHREHRRQRRTLQESGDFLGVTGANPQTGELDVITPPTGSEDAVATTTTTTTTTATAATTNAATAIATTARVSNSNKNRAAYVGAAGGAAPGVGVGAGVGMGTATDRLTTAGGSQWDLGELVAIPVDIRRVSGDCKVRQICCGRVVELDDTGNRADSLTPEMDNPDLKSPPSRTDMVLRASRPARSGDGPDSAFPSACTRTTTTTGSGRSPARYLLDARPFGATLDGSYDAPLIRRRSTATSLRCSTPRPSSVCSWPTGSPESRQLSGWLSLHSLGLGLRMLMSPTPAQEKGETARPADEPIPLSPPVPGATAAERASDTTSSSISQAQTGVHTEAEVVNPPVSQGPVPAKHRAQQPDWAMRKTMRRQSDPDSSRSPNQRDSEAGTPRSSPTCTRTSTYRMNQSAAEAEAEEAAMAAECIARGAARTAFAQNRAHHQEIPWVKAITITGVMAGPVSTRNPGRQHMDRHPHHGPRAPGAAAQKGRGQGAEEAKQQEEGQEENGKRKGQKRKGKGGAGSGGELEVDVQRWTRMAVVMLERIVASYWQLVSPVFDGRSELRKRVDRAQATQGDVVVCVLAALFLFLVVSAVAWAVRGVVWMVKLWGELWDVLRAVAGL
ncbi:uncharacterized protein THITE_118429 [Thermothielavioides terrestris NRRL 8126]|uniref:Uncharacterized protein n=1 Tax=Thermothielavioides terrestris (strain ATCC 38088 / NRRL 8126) TaxID=578455 RepID=G2QYG3_THETT|nr:uncharacterized protein THITE_118429 [Thermothielavioides terrestris NRRL 8126]AEO67058.1 hypothetical protein THITE_118429 [Thermothielavioides terrestris NRRL 8126]